jgi:prevent-host-death family protein
MTMEMIGLRELTHNAGKLVRSASLGNRIVITDRGRPVADLVPHSDPAGRELREAAVTSSINAMLALSDGGDLRGLDTVSDVVLSQVEW